MDNDSVIRKRLAILEKKILRRIYGPVYESDIGWKVRHNEELFELLDGTDIAKYIKFKELQWAYHMFRIDNSRILKKKYWMKNFMEED
jgi:hypothetical protein